MTTQLSDWPDWAAQAWQEASQGPWCLQDPDTRTADLFIVVATAVARNRDLTAPIAVNRAKDLARQRRAIERDVPVADVAGLADAGTRAADRDDETAITTPDALPDRDPWRDSADATERAGIRSVHDAATVGQDRPFAVRHRNSLRLTGGLADVLHPVHLPAHGEHVTADRLRERLAMVLADLGPAVTADLVDAVWQDGPRSPVARAAQGHAKALQDFHRARARGEQSDGARVRLGAATETLRAAIARTLATDLDQRAATVAQREQRAIRDRRRRQSAGSWARAAKANRDDRNLQPSERAPDLWRGGLTADPYAKTIG